MEIQQFGNSEQLKKLINILKHLTLSNFCVYLPRIKFNLKMKKNTWKEIITTAFLVLFVFVILYYVMINFFYENKTKPVKKNKLDTLIIDSNNSCMFEGIEVKGNGKILIINNQDSLSVIKPL